MLNQQQHLHRGSCFAALDGRSKLTGLLRLGHLLGVTLAVGVSLHGQTEYS